MGRGGLLLGREEEEKEEEKERELEEENQQKDEETRIKDMPLNRKTKMNS